MRALGEIFLELGLQLADLADVLSELGVGGALADAGQRPADAFCAVGDDAGGDQGVEDLNVAGFESGRHTVWGRHVTEKEYSG